MFILRVFCIVFINYKYIILLFLMGIVAINSLLFYKIKHFFVNNHIILKKSKIFFIIEIVMYSMIGIFSFTQLYSFAIIVILLSGFRISLLRGTISSLNMETSDELYYSKWECMLMINKRSKWLCKD